MPSSAVQVTNVFLLKYDPYLRPMLKKEDMDQISEEYQPQHDQYKIRSEMKLKEMDMKILSPDWAELYTDKKKGIVSWQRTSDEGVKSMKAEFIVEGTMINLLKVLN